ncbi:MAG: helix-turn-helix domain-containing protein [Geitlerinemataceae cyanobacterium]
MNPLKIQVSLGRVVREKRSQQGYSQESFADRVGLHRTYIGAFERGERNLSLQNLVRIANALGLPLSSLLAEAEQTEEIDCLLERDRTVTESLEQMVRELQPSKLALLLELATAMTSKIEEDIDPRSDLLTPEFTTHFSNRLLIHHATHEEKLTKKAFEYAFAAASTASGRTTHITVNSTYPGADVIVDNVHFSLKTEASQKISKDKITISKLMEARWIRECRTPNDFVTFVKERVVAHLQQYQRILILRAYDLNSEKIQYDLIEVPIALLLQISNLTANQFKIKSRSGGSRVDLTFNIDGAGRKAFSLILDGSVEKVTISGLDIRLCTRHGSWSVPRLK